LGCELDVSLVNAAASVREFHETGRHRTEAT
jgi:hypothetical protein